MPERLTARLLFSALLAAASVCACGHPADRAPPGYADACWGGRDNYPRYIAFSDRRVAILVSATEKDWPQLSRVVKEVAAEHGEHHPGEVEITLYTYRPEARFEPVGDTLVKKIQATWKDAKVERFPALPPSKKALPDSVRILLVQECAVAKTPRLDYCSGL